jgi:putative acyl-CoA dehydrogenase
MQTHDGSNQASPLVDYDVLASDRALVDALRASDAAWAEPALADLGKRAGSAEAIAWGFDANEHPPVLHMRERAGRRLDEVEYHPSYHRLMEVAVGSGLHSSSWRVAPKPGAHLARALGFYLWAQVDAGHGCPISMTYGVVPALRLQPGLAAEWEPRVLATSYDARLLPTREKGSALFGMALTEKQGGSDLRANATRAVPAGAGGPGAEYVVRGTKWFCSAPMCDAFLVLAQAPGGLGCFLMPRILPDGTPNAFYIQRLKDKLGNRSNASSEVEFDGAHTWLVGEEGRGVRTIVEMVNCTRVDCTIGSAAGMRQATVQAIHHMRHRRAFGKMLVDQPLASNVLADLALEAEAALFTAMRLADASDRAPAQPREAALRRILAAIAKFWVCKRVAPHAAEALECLGGNGYIEESIMPRLFRESPLNSIWEGAGNVNALDVLRAAREPGALDAYFAEVDAARGSDARLDAAIVALRAELEDQSEAEYRARRVAETMALVFQAALVVRRSPAFVSDAFLASRLGGDWGHTFGTLPRGCDTAAIVDRAFPA